MNDNAKAWVAALRSGQYTQGRGKLRRDEEFCCLGVACDLAVKAGLPIEIYIDEVDAEGKAPFYYDGTSVDLPTSVREWLKITDQSGLYGELPKQFSGAMPSLVNDNDDGKTFAEIADIIEAHEGVLFR